MGQKMSVNPELCHAMKKLRLLQESNDEYVGEKLDSVTHVINGQSPFSPLRKEAGRQLKVLAAATAAPLVNTSISDENDEWNEENCRDEEGQSNLYVSGADTLKSITVDDPILYGQNDRDQVCEVAVELDAVTTGSDDECQDPVTNQDLLTFFRNSEKNKKIFNRSNCSFEKNKDDKVFLKTVHCFSQKHFFLEGLEPSNEALIRYLKRDPVNCDDVSFNSH